MLTISRLSDSYVVAYCKGDTATILSGAYSTLDAAKTAYDSIIQRYFAGGW